MLKKIPNFDKYEYQLLLLMQLFKSNRYENPIYCKAWKVFMGEF